MNINWYPGHMSKTKKLILENIKIVDVIIEILDARAPMSSKNPDIDVFAQNKPKIIVLNKSDLANRDITQKWKAFYEKEGNKVVEVNSITGAGVNKVVELTQEIMKPKIERDLKRGRINRPTRAMIVGIPNSGKSTFINNLVGKAGAKTGDKPGVTKGKQWLKIRRQIELLDTPGILWPKFEDQQTAKNLAFIGSVKDDILDIVTLSYNLIKQLQIIEPQAIKRRYKIDIEEDMDPQIIFEKIAVKRGFIMPGNQTDDLRTAQIFLDEFRAGKLGNISIESPTK